MATPLKNTFKRGYSSVYFLMVEGIPYTFVEKEPLRVDADSSPSAASGRTTVKGLIVDQSPTISMEVDRKAGIGRGASVTFTLGYKDLERAGVLDDIFARATLQTEITADVSATRDVDDGGHHRISFKREPVLRAGIHKLHRDRFSVHGLHAWRCWLSVQT